MLLMLRAGCISSAYRKPHTCWQHHAALTGGMTRAASKRTTTRRALGSIAVGLVVITAAIFGTVVYQSASSSATSPPQPGTARQGPVAPRSRSLGAIAWPASGVSAAGISGIGVLPGPGASQPVPIASVAKVMTAYIILRDHPLGAGESGPPIVVQPGEAAASAAQARNGDSLVAVTAGEQLTERQAPEALLPPSADNMPSSPARWEAGTQAAFTAQMNATARRLGMSDTHYPHPPRPPPPPPPPPPHPHPPPPPPPRH